MTSQTKIAPPFDDQTFDNFQQWVNRASSWLTCHPEYNNTEHGETKGWRGKHFTTLCFDSFGRRCRNGGDFQRAHDEGAFPVWWIWPDQIVEAITHRAAITPTPDTTTAQVAAEVVQQPRDDLKSSRPAVVGGER